MLQQTSASGVIIVEDDPIWFSPAGCEPLLRLLQSPVRAHPSHLCMQPCWSTRPRARRASSLPHSMAHACRGLSAAGGAGAGGAHPAL